MQLSYFEWLEPLVAQSVISRPTPSKFTHTSSTHATQQLALDGYTVIQELFLVVDEQVALVQKCGHASYTHLMAIGDRMRALQRLVCIYESSDRSTYTGTCIGLSALHRLLVDFRSLPKPDVTHLLVGMLQKELFRLYPYPSMGDRHTSEEGTKDVGAPLSVHRELASVFMWQAALLLWMTSLDVTPDKDLFHRLLQVVCGISLSTEAWRIRVPLMNLILRRLCRAMSSFACILMEIVLRRPSVLPACCNPLGCGNKAARCAQQRSPRAPGQGSCRTHNFAQVPDHPRSTPADAFYYVDLEEIEASGQGFRDRIQIFGTQQVGRDITCHPLKVSCRVAGHAYSLRPPCSKR